MIQENANYTASQASASAGDARPEQSAGGVRVEQCEFERLLERAMQVLGPSQHLQASDRKTTTNFSA